MLKFRLNKNRNNEAEIRTREFDAESMHYLSYLLYPVVVGGAIYSLLYQPHKRSVDHSEICPTCTPHLYVSGI